jgi:AsmA protein
VTAAIGFKRLGIAAVAAGVMGLLALVLATFLVSADTAREALMAEVRAATGLRPVLRGSVSVSMFPSASVTLSDVVLRGDKDGPAEAGGELAFAADRMVAHFRLLPLLAGRVEIADVLLVHPQIALNFDADGRSNWSPLIDTLAHNLRPGNRGERVLSFSEIRITDGEVTVRDASRVLTETLSGVELSLAWPAISKTFAATGRVLWHQEPVDVSFTVGDFPAALAGDNTGVKFRLNGAPMKVAFDGTMGYRPSFKIDGNLAADGSSLREAVRWMSGKTFPGSGLGRFALKARTAAVGGTIGMSGLNVELDGNVAEGVLAYVTTGRPTLQGTLAVEGLDLAPYGSAWRLMASGARGWNGRPIALDWFNDFDFDLRLSAARVTAGTVKLGRTAVAAALRNGRLALTIGESQAFNGVIKGSFALAKTEEGANLRSQMLFSDVDLESCLAELLGVRRLEGKGTMTFAIEGSGPSILALTRTLSGTASLTSRAGALTGFNVEQLLRRLERRPLSGSGEFRTGRTPYENLNVTMRIAQGVAAVEDVRMQGTNVRLAVEGSTSISARELDLTGTASLLSTPEAAPAFELPFVIQGTWDDPIMLPDTQALIRRSGAAAPLLDALSERRNRDAVRSAIERLTGSTPPRPPGNAVSAEPPAAAPR